MPALVLELENVTQKSAHDVAPIVQQGTCSSIPKALQSSAKEGVRCRLQVRFVTSF